nr:hypothetical protein Itr_chr15CG11690 [Ipomoea trifida]
MRLRHMLQKWMTNDHYARAFHGSAPRTTMATDGVSMSIVLVLSMDLLQELRLKTVKRGLMSTLLEIFTDLLRELLLATERSIWQSRSISCLPILEHSNLKESASFDNILNLVR